MYKEGDKVVVILTVEESPDSGAKYLSVAYDDTVIEINIEDALPLTPIMEVEFLEQQLLLISQALSEKKKKLPAYNQ